MISVLNGLIFRNKPENKSAGLIGVFRFSDGLLEDAAIYDTTFAVPSLRERLESAQPLVVENLRQLPTVSAICNAATFEGSPSDSKRNIIGDATGKATGA